MFLKKVEECWKEEKVTLPLHSQIKKRVDNRKDFETNRFKNLSDLQNADHTFFE
jgi:hypothetical protein